MAYVYRQFYYTGLYGTYAYPIKKILMASFADVMMTCESLITLYIPFFLLSGHFYIQKNGFDLPPRFLILEAFCFCLSSSLYQWQAFTSAFQHAIDYLSYS